MRRCRHLVLLAASGSSLTILASVAAAQEIENFQNFVPTTNYDGWTLPPPFTTITSAPTYWETASTQGYGSCYYDYYDNNNQGQINVTSSAMLQLSFTVNSGDAGMFVDLDDGEGDEWQWMMGGFGLQPGTYVIDEPLTVPTAKVQFASRNELPSGFDAAQITGMNFELDPGATGGNPNPYDVTWTDLSAVNPNLTWNNANYTTLNFLTATADGATWDSAKNLNWNNGTNASVYADGSFVTFNDQNSGNYAVTLNSVVRPGSVTFNNSLGNYTISGTGAIAGSTSLAKSGTGILTLNTANTCSGGTTVSNGTLALGNPKALGFGGIVTGLPGSTSVTTNGTIDLAGQTVTQPITLNGGSLINSNTATTAGVTSGVLGDGIVTSTTALSGDAKLTYAGSGTGAAATPVLGISAATYTLTSGGSGYTGRSASNPTVTVTGGGGTGAVLAAVTNTSGVVTAIDIINPGSGYTSAPTITISAPAAGGTQATVSAFDLFGLLGIQQTAAGSGYFTAPTATITATSGSAVLGTPAISGINLAGTGNIGGPGNITLAGTVTGVGMLNKIGTGTVTLTAPNNYSGGTTVAAGNLIVGVSGALPNGNVSIANGNLQLAPSTGLAAITSLAITGNGTLDVSNNHVIVNYGSGTDPVASIAALLKTGFNGGTWNGAGGIVSSTAAITPGYGLGYADSLDTGNPAGLSSGTLEIKYTLLGDANLDGVVNAVDFGILAANFNKGVSRWDQGDFNYDNVVSAIDFGELASNFNKGASGASIGAPAWADPAILQFAAANGLLADVPEPASIGLFAVGALAILKRRRRREV